jgi:hypothetical protein
MNLVTLAVTLTEVDCNNEDYCKGKGANAKDISVLNTGEKVARFFC